MNLPSWFPFTKKTKPTAKAKPVRYKVEFITSFILGYSQTSEHISTMGIEDGPIDQPAAEKKYKDEFNKRVAAVKRELRTKRFVDAANGMVRSAAVKNLSCRMVCHRRVEEKEVQN